MENIFGVRTDIASVDADQRFVMVGRKHGVVECFYVRNGLMVFRHEVSSAPVSVVWCDKCDDQAQSCVDTLAMIRTHVFSAVILHFNTQL